MPQFRRNFMKALKKKRGFSTSFFNGVVGGTWTRTDLSTRPSNVRVYHSATTTYSINVLNFQSLYLVFVAEVFTFVHTLSKTILNRFFGRVPLRHIINVLNFQSFSLVFVAEVFTFVHTLSKTILNHFFGRVPLYYISLFS